jgi:hypothetical protein
MRLLKRTSLLPWIGSAGVLLVWVVPAAALDMREFVGDRCLAGMRPITYEEAVFNRDEVCRRIAMGTGDWGIWRIADGGAVGGPGYKCTIHRHFNAVPVGAILCINVSTPAPTVKSTAGRILSLDATSKEFVQRFAPELRFDRAASQYGYPMSAQPFYDKMPKDEHGVPKAVKSASGFPMENNDGATLKSGRIPTYFQLRKFGNQIRISYWWFYGFQHSCVVDTKDYVWGTGAHHGDWEHVMVILSEDTSRVAAVTFWQHDNYYTRIAGPRDAPCTPGGIGRCSGSHGFESSGTHPVVYVGKIGHGSYHDSNGRTGGCGYYEEFRNPDGPGDYMQTWLNLIDLDDDADVPSETWRVNDRWGPTAAPERPTWRWGPYDNIGTHPTQAPPAASMDACAGSATYRLGSAGCFKSECLAGDDQASEDCLKECEPGYDNAGLTCNKGKAPWEWKVYGRLTGGHKYGYPYTLPLSDVGLLRRRSNESEWDLP